jgi:hypothetical protein
MVEKIFEIYSEDISGAGYTSENDPVKPFFIIIF